MLHHGNHQICKQRFFNLDMLNFIDKIPNTVASIFTHDQSMTMCLESLCLQGPSHYQKVLFKFTTKFQG